MVDVYSKTKIPEHVNSCACAHMSLNKQRNSCFWHGYIIQILLISILIFVNVTVYLSKYMKLFGIAFINTFLKDIYHWFFKLNSYIVFHNNCNKWHSNPYINWKKKFDMKHGSFLLNPSFFFLNLYIETMPQLHFGLRFERAILWVGEFNF